MNMDSPILLPLDTATADDALRFASLLKSDVGGFKVGLELINAAGFGIFDGLRAVDPDARIFYDCKLHDIPNTVAGAARAIGRRGLWMFNVHASGGCDMMRAAVRGAKEGADTAGAMPPLTIAVTVLTSLSEAVLEGEVGIRGGVQAVARDWARLAQDAGCDGVVASPREVATIREACGPQFLLVTPGVRPAGADSGDQRRITTPTDAIQAGADWLVVGRPITQAADPASAARAVNAEADAARRNKA